VIHNDCPCNEESCCLLNPVCSGTACCCGHSRGAAAEEVALETLRKLLTDQIRVTERTNIVQSKKFREGLEDAMLRYTNKAITTAEMISRLLDLAKHLRNAQRHGEELGLQGRDGVLRRPCRKRVSQGDYEERRPTAHGPRANGDGEKDAEARLDPTRVGTRWAPVKC
jgi:Domain of unknown function (DUF3387)